MMDIEERALERAMIRRGELPAPTPPPPAAASQPPSRPSDRFRQAAAGEEGGMREGVAAVERAARGVAGFAAEVFSLKNVGREIAAAVQGVEPVLIEEAIKRGALRPLTDQELAATDGPQEREHFTWDGKVYARRFTDPETGEAVDVTTPDTTFGRLSRLGRWMGASMAVDADIAGPAAAARALRGNRGAASTVRSGVGPEDARRYDNVPSSATQETIMEPQFIDAVDANRLVFREKYQNNIEANRERFPEGEGYTPIVVINESDGSLSIVDGHNRAVIAQERGDNLPAVSITRAVYEALKGKGLDDIDISHAALERAGQDEAASYVRQQFSGADLFKSAAIADEVFDGP